MRSFLLLSAAGLLMGCQAASMPRADLHKDNIKTLAVTGVGEVEIMPDTYVISGAIIKKHENAKTAMNALASVVNRVQTSAQGLDGQSTSDFNFASVNTVGVKDPDCLLFNQEADRTNASLRKREIRVKKKVCEDVAQQASLTFTYTGGPPGGAGLAISRFSKAGAIRIKLEGYRIKNIDEIELQAGEIAVKNARAKADRLAGAAGAHVTGVLDLNSYRATYDQRNVAPPHINTSGAGESAQLADGGDPVDVTDMNLEAGLQVVSAAIALEFTYE